MSILLPNITLERSVNSRTLTVGVRLKEMKKLTALILLALCCGCSKVDLSDGDFAPPYSVSIGGASHEVELQPGEPLTVSVQKWLQANSSGWSKSMVTYAPNVEIRNKRFSLNFTGQLAVLNFQPHGERKWIQVVKDCATSELKFLNEIRKRYGAEHPSGG